MHNSFFVGYIAGIIVLRCNVIRISHDFGVISALQKIANASALRK